jgi:hypothetical protein
MRRTLVSSTPSKSIARSFTEMARLVMPSLAIGKQHNFDHRRAWQRFVGVT